MNVFEDDSDVKKFALMGKKIQQRCDHTIVFIRPFSPSSVFTFAEEQTDKKQIAQNWKLFCICFDRGLVVLPEFVGDSPEIPTMAIGDQAGVNCGLDVLPEYIRRDSTMPHCESAIEKHHKLQCFQTVNHSKIIWDRGAKPKGILGGHLNVRSM